MKKLTILENWMKRLGGMGGKSLGPKGTCVCPDCGYTTDHILGEPCNEKTCPKCEAQMDRSE